MDKTLKDFFEHQEEDIIRVRNEFKEGMLEFDISPRQAIWLIGILHDFDKNGMNARCSQDSAKFLQNMMEKINE